MCVLLAGVLKCLEFAIQLAIQDVESGRVVINLTVKWQSAFVGYVPRCDTIHEAKHAVLSCSRASHPRRLSAPGEEYAVRC